jgi:hypothetical protein
MKFAASKEEPKKATTLSKLIVDNCVFTQRKDISNQINNYVATVSEKLVQDLDKIYPTSNSFHSYCNDFVKNKMFCSPVDKYELITLINSLVD